MTARLRGRAAVKQRARRLRADPLCQDCKAKGLVRLADVVDHITPLAKGGDDSDANTRNLCDDCHYVRTGEQFGFKTKPRFGADGWPI